MTNSKSMRRLVAAVAFPCMAMAVNAQPTSEYGLVLSGGLSSLSYTVNGGLTHKPGYGGSAGLSYRLNLSSTVSMTVGADYSLLGASLSAASIRDSAKMKDNDYQKDEFMFRYTMEHYSETQSLGMLSIPLMVNFHFGTDTRYYVGFGARVGIPLSAHYESRVAAFRARGYYPSLDEELGGPNAEIKGYGFGDFTPSTSASLSLNTSVQLSLEAGARWKLADGWWLYTAIYADYGLTSLTSVPNPAPQPYTGTPGTGNEDYDNFYGLNTMLTASNAAGAAYSGKVSAFSAGLRLRIAFNPTEAQNHSKANTNHPIHDAVHSAHSTHPASDRTISEASPIYRQDSPLVPNAAEKAGFEEPISNFAVSGAQLSQASRTELDEKLAFIRKYPNLRITIEGHTDATGNAQQDRLAGSRRALAARNYLIDHGIDGTRITTISKGSTQPLVANDTDEHRAMNRRVTFRVE